MAARPRIALVHDWVTTFGGAERCLILLHQMFPDAPIYTLVHDRSSTPPELERATIITSPLQRMPGATRNWQKYLPLMPYSIEQLDLRGYDLVISSSHAVAKGVLTDSSQKHLCYCYTPMRYVWDLYQTYLEHTRLSPLAAWAFRWSAHYLRMWDLQSAQRVDKFVAISATIQQRIRRIYGREAPVVFPPVDTDYFVPDPHGQHDYYLAVSRFVPYKRMDLIIETFNHRQEKLLIVGDGPQGSRLRRMAGRNIEFIGAVSDEELRVLYQNCRALVFPAMEDFGIIPVEAQACGRPVVALGKGGTAETVVDGRTGVLFPEQTPQALDAAIDALERGSFDSQVIREHARSFDKKVFVAKMQAAAQYLLDS